MGKSIGEKIIGEHQHKPQYTEFEDRCLSEINRLRRSVTDLEAQKNGAYSERNKILSGMCSMAIALGFPAYIMPHDGEDWDADWRNIVVIEGPTGQLTWHVHDSEVSLFKGLPQININKWDGHDTEEKYRRVVGLCEVVPVMRRHRESNGEKSKCTVADTQNVPTGAI